MEPGAPTQGQVDEAWRHFAGGDLDAALLAASAARRDAPDSAGARAALGYFLIQAGHLDEAARTLLPARDRFPAYAPLHWYTGYLLRRRGDLAGAAEALRRACELDAGLDEAAHALAWVLHDLGRLDEAAAWAAHALATGRMPPRLLQMAWFLQAGARFGDAAALYREAIAAFAPSAPEQPRLHMHLSQCLDRLGRHAEAAAVLEEALGRWPRDPDLGAQAVRRLQVRGDGAQARRHAVAWVEQFPDNAGAWHLLGIAQQEAGELEAADASFARCQALDPGLTDALLRRAEIQRGWGRYEGAQWLLGLVLERAPGDQAAQGLLAQVALDLEDVAQARRVLLRLLRTNKHAPDPWRLLAVAQHKRGRPRAALRWLHRALAGQPDAVEALRILGWVALELGDADQAAQAVRRLVAQVPDDVAAQVQAALVFARTGELETAQAWAERAVACTPESAEAWRALSFVRLRQRRLDDADRAAREALRLAPAQPDCLRQLGWVQLALSRLGQAQLAFLRALDAKPDDVVARLELAEAQRLAGHFEAGLQTVAPLLESRVDRPAALLARTRLLTEAGHGDAVQACARLLRADRHLPDAAKAAWRLVGLGHADARRLLAMLPVRLLLDTWREAVAQAVHTQGQDVLVRLATVARQELDDDPWMSLAALYAASLTQEATAEGLALQARDAYRVLKIRAGLAGLPARRPAAAGEPLCIAYVAGQLHESLLRRVLAAHDRLRVRVLVYTNRPFRGLPEHVQVLPLYPERLAESCAAHRVDIAIDAGGLHPFEGQFEVLQAFARRLAPVQVGWLGCWGGAGGLFDALLTDDAAWPSRSESLYEEEILGLAGGQWSWDPPLHAPEPAPAPVLARGSVTFGVTARSLRLGDDCVDSFARVVASTPGSVIRFIGAVAQDWPLRRRILAGMQARGIEGGRVFFDPFVPHDAYLAWLGRVDLVLDSFPGNGGLSLLDPLWMGVPVVTRAGDWPGARQGVSLLSAIGCPEWAAEDTDGFVAKAVALAGDVAALARHRATLRSRLLGSPLVDGRRVAAQIEDHCARLHARYAGAAVLPDAKSRTKAHAQAALAAWLDRGNRIDLPTVPAEEVPELSVVVVLFNQAGLSRRTLQALADQRGVRFETLIVDNASSDRTADLLERVRGARVLRNDGNLGFLLAARQGAAQARGCYLVFLNSDAILQEGALAAAWHAMQDDPSIGVLGGRVVLTDGGLQEAGNAVFDDGSAGGVGRGEDAFGHAALAARATDYVSGVLLVTPAPLWRMLGGFDEAFAPAYYEDTDYCLRAWRAGFRVVYEPRVLLEHLEWGSATGDSARVLMERNRQVFRDRHSALLSGQSSPRALSLEGDRWRSPQDRPRLPRVLMLDNEVPHMFKGGGLPRARLMLQALRDWPVTLFPLWEPDDLWRAVYASVPETVEVALGHGMGGLEAFLQRRRGVYDVLLVSRPPNLAALRPLRERRPELFAGMRLVYDAEALFALREIAMAGVQGRPLSPPVAKERLRAELALADGASDVLVVSERDARHFEAAGYRTHVLSHAVAVRRDAPGPAGRSGLLFVGALHPGTPNEDGLLWFVQEVMPRLRQRLGRDTVLSVVGVCQSEKVAALAGEHVKVLGPQDMLEPHYDAARVFVAPVRFAGGVPAKVIEAAASGIPTVASALLVRQLAWRDGLDVIGARDAAAFAAAVARLLSDDVAWRQQQDAAWQQCTRRYDPGFFGLTLRRVLQAGEGTTA